MRLIATVYYWVMFALTAVIGFCLGSVVWAFTAPFDRQRRVLHAVMTGWTFQYLRIWPGWSAKVTGRELLPRGPAVFIANHQSAADVVALMGLYHQFKFVSKSSLFKLPLVGWMMSMMKYIHVERGRPHSTQRMIDDCRRWLSDGMSVVIFPEGTYSTGGKLLPFKRGAFLLAIELQVPIVPVLIRGTPDLIFEDGPWLSPRAHVQVTVLPPVSAAELGTDDAAAAAAMRARFERELAALPVGRP